MTKSSNMCMPSASTKDQESEHPAREFSDPAELVANPSLSAQEKCSALDALEQDARQIAVATAEGMAGGEATRLRAVLEAKRTFERRLPAAAFTDILETLEHRLQQSDTTDVQFAIAKAIDAVISAQQAVARHQSLPEPPPCAPESGSAQEIQEEIDKENLDPGGSVRS